jgi:hypothetical protein
MDRKRKDQELTREQKDCPKEKKIIKIGEGKQK